MKKLLLVLLVLALVSFLFVGCLSVTPSEEEEDCDYSDIAITVNTCTCYGCNITFQYLPGIDVCSELDYFLIALYDTFPFNDSCDIPWGLEPVTACTGMDYCPFFCKTPCLEAGVYYAVINLISNTGSTSTYYAKIDIAGGYFCGIDDCAIEVYQGYTTSFPPCIIWNNTTSNTLETCQQ